MEKFIQMSYSHSCADKIQKGGRPSLTDTETFPSRGVKTSQKFFFSRERVQCCPADVRRAIVQVCLISNAKRVMFEMMWLGGSAMFGQLGSHSERLRRSRGVKNVSSSRALVVAWPCRLLKSRVMNITPRRRGKSPCLLAGWPAASRPMKHHSLPWVG